MPDLPDCIGGGTDTYTDWWTLHTAVLTSDANGGVVLVESGLTALDFRPLSD